MNPLTVAICTLACFILYNVIKVAVKLLKIGSFSDYTSKSDGPQGIPIIGLAYLFMGSAEATMKKIIDMGKTYPPSFQTSLGKIPIFVTGIPEQLKVVLLSSKTIEKNEFFDFARPWLGNGIFIAPASIWEVHRKLIQPSFNSIALKSFVEIFSAQTAILVKKMERHLDGPEFEIHKYLSLCTFDVICETAMGINLEAQTKENCDYGEAADKVIAGITKRSLSPWLYPDFIFYRTRLGKDQQKNIKFLHGFVDDVIRAKKERISQCTSQRESVGNKQDAANSLLNHREILIDNLIKLSNHNKILTDEMVREEVDTMMVAGSDTTTVVGSFVIMMLASQPGVQEKAYQELCDIFGGNAADDDNGEPPVTSEVLVRMTYMERVIKETMRLFPIGPLLFRKATDDLDLGNCTVPKGSTVALNIIAVHRNEKYWPDPLKFDPDRFLPERFAQQEPFSYLPFSGGPRNCIGSKYAMMLIKTFTTMILRRYVLAVDKATPVEDVRLKMEFMMRPAVPIAIRIKRRIRFLRSQVCPIWLERQNNIVTYLRVENDYTRRPLPRLANTKMDPLTAAICVVACFIFYNIINVAIQLLLIGPLSDYAPKSEGPRTLPFIGVAYLTLGGTEVTLKRILEVGKAYPPCFKTSIGNISIFVTVIPEQLKVLFLSSKTTEKNEFYDFGRPWLGDGLITASGSVWNVHRKLIQPSFNHMILKSYVNTFSAQSSIMAKKLERHLDGPEFQIHKYLSLCTLDVICETAMGIKLEAQTSESCDFGEVVENVISGVVKRITSPWLYPDFIFYRTQLGKEQQKNIKFLHEFSDNIIREKKKEIHKRMSQRESADNEQVADSSSTHFETLIDGLLKLSNDNKILTDKAVREQVDTMMTAGSDTSAITASFLMMMLASHPDVQEKAYQELTGIFGGDSAYDDSGELQITPEALSSMIYMERVIKETMRLFPVAPIIFRKLSDDLDLDQYTLLKGSTVALNIIGVHRSEKYWTDPLTFDPDRFLPERFANQRPFSYLPFSGGARNCIGSKYAMMFLKTIAATILWKYVIRQDNVIPDKDVRIKIEFLLRPVIPISVRIERRTRKHDFA
ncbi:uncharacterized protein LOC124305582 [Neodiprion virginianus]|uniref:uncharacterized protein LOC124305582 n=1 Tax=Neodiprion virginianus TaxID=2961670 RepID=UPI001EE69DFD|nr:uncharacterized protein LOC124305582 [Neodiprion virginianus]